MNNKNNKNKYTIIVIALVLLVSIGYAALTTALKINSNVAFSKVTFDVHFDNVTALEHKAEVIEEAHITNDAKTEISFDVSIKRIDDYYAFKTDIVNEGSLPAKIKSIEFEGITEAQKKIMNYRVYYTNTGKTLTIGDYFAPDSSKNVTVEVIYQLDENITEEELPVDDVHVNCTFIINLENGSMNEFRARAASNRLMQQTDFFPTEFVRFTQPTSSDEHLGIYRLDGTENDDYPIYFYRGDNEHIKNHVNFGGYCWRIIRTTSTGGIKIIYNGRPNEQGQCMTLTGEDTVISYHAYSTGRGNNLYAGNTLQYYLNTWYFENFIKNQAYLEDTDFCNDRNYSNGYISLDCAEGFNVSMANGKNQYPIGLISAPEANLCGMAGSGSAYPWLYSGTTYWMMSSDAYYYYDYAWFADSSGAINNGNNWSRVYVTAELGVRPVVSLNSEVVFDTGDGSQEHPYTVSLG